MRFKREDESVDLEANTRVTPEPALHDRSLRKLDRFVVGLGAIAFGGLVIRVIFVAFWASKKLSGDASYYFWQAEFVAKGQGFVPPLAILDGSTAAAAHPPGFVIMLAGLRLIGLNTPKSGRYAMCVLGSMTIIVAALLIKKLIGRRVGLIAAFLVAFYPPIWINDGMLMSETLFLFAFALTLWFSFSVWDRPRVRNVVGLSVAIAVTMSTRPESALLYLFIALPVIISRSNINWKQRVGLLGLAAAIPMIVFAPWVLYNQSRFEKPVYLSTGFGQTLLAANCDLTYYGRWMGYYSVACLSPEHGAPPIVVEPSVNDLVTRRAAINYMKAHPKQLRKVVVAREARMWGIYKVRTTVSAEAHIERGIGVWLAWAEMWAYWAMALLAIPGFFIWRRQKTPTFPLLAEIASTFLVTGITFGLTRYRVGADLCLIMFAAATLDLLAQQATTRLGRSGT